jgi:hypothetical protein
MKFGMIGCQKYVCKFCICVTFSCMLKGTNLLMLKFTSFVFSFSNRIPSNPSVTSKSSAGKVSTGSIERTSERGSPMPTFHVEVLSPGHRENKRNSLPDYCFTQKWVIYISSNILYSLLLCSSFSAKLALKNQVHYCHVP